MLPNNIIEFLRNKLEAITNKPTRITSSGELECTCPFCGGSKTKIYKRQFYINIKQSPYLYNCFKCGSKGTIVNLINYFGENGYLRNEDFSFSNLLDLKNNNKYKDLSSLNIEPIKRLFNLYSKRRLNIKNNLDILNKVYSDEALEYLNKRFNFKKWFIINTHNISSIFNNLLDNNELSYIFNDNIFGIGILSYKKSLLQVRFISDNPNFRYKSYKLISDENNNKIIKFDFPIYFIEPLNINYNNIDIYIAEGFFTLVNGIIKLYNDNYINKNSLILGIVAYGKEQYRNALIFGLKELFLKVGMYKNIRLNILCDNDVTIDEMKDKFKFMKFNNLTKFITNINFLYPPKDVKDFGDLIDQNSKFLLVK